VNSTINQFSMKQVTTFLFDWDGTLADSAELGLSAFKKTFGELGVAFPMDVYEAAYSPNWYATYEALGLPKDKWQKADDLWLQHYGAQTAALIPGVAETLLDLHGQGYRLGVVSSGSESRVGREIKMSVLNSVFGVVVCNEHIIQKKPHPEGLELALEKLQSPCEVAVYVGDAPEDIQMGKSAGVLTVGVRSNYPSSRRLLAAEPDIYIESLTELTRHFNLDF
jgi:HAD superfamily hydrolase (TIGR01549 family)